MGDAEQVNFRTWPRAAKARAALSVFLLAALPTAIWGIMLRMPGTSFAGPLPDLSADERALSDALKRDLDMLSLTIGERNVEHPVELARAATWLEAQLRGAGYEPQRQTYDVAGMECANIEAELHGSSAPDEIVLVGAHYDSASGSPGANDNGTGAVSVLALARAFAGTTPRRTVRFVEFVNEEPPYFRSARMGSAVYAERSARLHERVVAMLSLETMGAYSDEPGSQKYPFPMDLLYPDQGNFIAFVGNVDSRALVREAIGAFRSTTRFPSEGAALPERTVGVGWSDHEPFWKAGYPAIMLTDTALFRYGSYHTRADTPDKVDVDRLARVTRGVAQIIEQLANPGFR